MAKKFRLQQALRQRAAIDRDERRELAAAVEMQRAGDEFLARAAFAKDEDGAVRIGDALDHFADGLHLGRRADELAELIFLLELLAEIKIFGNRFVVGKGALDAQVEFVELEGFFQVIVGAIFHGVHGGFNGAERGDDNHAGGRGVMERAFCTISKPWARVLSRYRSVMTSSGAWVSRPAKASLELV